MNNKFQQAKEIVFSGIWSTIWVEMKLKEVQITNFRSIEYSLVQFDPRCRVLVGINESGKSNILRALSLLGNDFKPIKKDDFREALPDEKPVEVSRVRFIFSLEKEDNNLIYNSIYEKIAAVKRDAPIASTSTSKLSLKKVCEIPKESLYDIDIVNENKSFKYWDLGKSYNLISDWKKPSDSCPKEFMINIDGTDQALSSFGLVRTSDFEGIPTEYLATATFDDLSTLIGNAVIDITDGYKPEVLFWQYDAKNLLPNSIDLTQFADNPDSLPPLKNMFLLAGISKIKESIEDKRKGTDNQFQNYLNGIAKKTTNHFKSVWKDYKGIEFSLRLNGNAINPGVKEKNTHDFERRSDGFKRFITFLLMISVGAQTESIQDTLLLIDEPDISLHPSGSRYLKDELIRISRNNYVVFSTHSIFMIDTGDIQRHYIVKKNKEITTIEVAGESNVADEEVLYNALGYSIFATLKEKNIIFEGWNDKHLFFTYISGAPASLKKKFKDIGICHSRGARNIKTITPMIELAKRKCLIISDSDSAAKDEQKAYWDMDGYGDWKNYQDINKSIQAVTGEDFVKNSHLAQHVNEVMNGSGLPNFLSASLPNKKDKLKTINSWLVKNGLTPKQAAEKIKEIKSSVFAKLKASDIEDEYKILPRSISF